MASKDLGFPSQSSDPTDLGLSRDGLASAAARDISGEREEGRLCDVIFVRDLAWKGQPSALTPTTAFLGAAGVFDHQASSGKGSHGQQTPAEITKEINVLPSLQTTAARGCVWGGREWQQLPKTLRRNNLIA